MAAAAGQRSIMGCDVIDFLERARQIIAGESEESKQERLATLELVRQQELVWTRQTLLGHSGLPKASAEQTFDTFKIRDDGQREAQRIAQLFVRRLPQVSKGLMIHGESGRGKSHLARAIVREATQKQSPVRAYYVNCFALARQMKQNGDLEANMLDCELLMLDDIEKALAGDAAPWVRALVKSVIDTIDERGRPILASTSEFSLEGHRTSGMPAYLLGRLGKLMHWQEITGPDGRAEEYQTFGGAWWAD